MNAEKHPWWHKFFESLYRIVQYRDGCLGGLTPDFNEYHYRCNWFGCNYHRVDQKVFK